MNDSKKLAELLQIEPRYRCKKNIYNDTWRFKELVTVIDRHNLNNPDDLWCLDDFEAVYPCFEKPANFVKLLNLIIELGYRPNFDRCINKDFAVDIENIEGYHKKLETAFLKASINLFEFEKEESESGEDYKYMQNIKQQAQQVNWEY